MRKMVQYNTCPKKMGFIMKRADHQEDQRRFHALLPRMELPAIIIF